MSRSASYGNSTTLGNTMGATWVSNLTSLPGSTAGDVQAQARADADNEIDAALADRYSVPFAAIGDATPTPQVIQTVSNILTVYYLVIRRQAQGVSAEEYRDLADRWLSRLRSGEYSVPGATELTGDQAAVTVSYKRDSQSAEFAGYDTSNDDADNMGNW